MRALSLRGECPFFSLQKNRETNKFTYPTSGLFDSILTSKKILCRNMTYHIVITTDNNIFIVLGFFFQHFPFGYFQTAFNFIYHLLVLIT